MTRTLAEYREYIQLRIDNADNPIGQIEALVEMAVLQIRTAEVTQADAAIERAYSMCETLTKPDRAIGNTYALYGTGIIAYYRADYTVAISALLNALEAARVARNLVIRARALAMLAFICGRLGSQRDGIEYGLSAIDIASRIGDARAIVQSYVALGNLYNDRDDPKSARQEFESALEACNQLGDPLTIAAVHCNLAASAYKAARAALEASNQLVGQDKADVESHTRAMIDSSFSICRDVLRRCRESGNRFSEVSALGNLAEMVYLDGDLPQALSLINETYQLALQGQNLDQIAYTQYLRGLYLLESGQLADAKTALASGLVAAKQSGFLDAETRIHKVIAQCDEAEGNFINAIAAYKRHIAGIDKQRTIERFNMQIMADVRRQFDLMRRRGTGA
jgi:tetratricopeptide (TPR) repeat protein